VAPPQNQCVCVAARMVAAHSLSGAPGTARHCRGACRRPRASAAPLRAQAARHGWRASRAITRSSTGEQDAYVLFDDDQDLLMEEVERLAKENAALAALMEERVRFPTALLAARCAGSSAPGWAHLWHPRCPLLSSQCGS
jgi:hypothetical protein